MRLYRAVLTHTDIQITVRIWSTTDHDWTWTPLDTWTPDPTRPHQPNWPTNSTDTDGPPPRTPPPSPR